MNTIMTFDIAKEIESAEIDMLSSRLKALHLQIQMR